MTTMNTMALNSNELEMVNGGKSLASKVGKWLYHKLFSEEKQQVYDPCNTCPEMERIEDFLKEDIEKVEKRPGENLIVDLSL